LGLGLGGGAYGLAKFHKRRKGKEKEVMAADQQSQQGQQGQQAGGTPSPKRRANAHYYAPTQR
jgi:hypothetical protein